MVKVAALFLSILLVGCSSINAVNSHPPLSDIRVKEAGADGENEFCRSFELSDAQVKSYFERAEEISFKQQHDEFDYLPCYVKGTLQRQGEQCEFVIRAGATAEVVCKNNLQIFYGCMTCDDIFQPGR
jgi:hypothetical protein